MKKRELAGQLARQARLSRAAAADRLDQVVHDILTQLRQGKPASFPGLGRFTPGQAPGFEFEPPAAPRARRGERRQEK